MSQRPLPSVAVRIEPAQLVNPDVDLRWELERMLKAKLPNVSLIENGYGFCRHSEAMLISYRTTDVDSTVAALIDIAENELVSGNRLASAVLIATAPLATDEFSVHRVVYPAQRAGSQLPD